MRRILMAAVLVLTPTVALAQPTRARPSIALPALRLPRVQPQPQPSPQPGLPPGQGGLGATEVYSACVAWEHVEPGRVQFLLNRFSGSGAQLAVLWFDGGQPRFSEQLPSGGGLPAGYGDAVQALARRGLDGGRVVSVQYQQGAGTVIAMELRRTRCPD